MEFEMYVIYDARSNKYSAPMLFDNDAVAVRTFVNEGLKAATSMNNFPEDFVLFKTGIFHESDGTIQSFQSPERICCMSDYITKENR